VHLVVKGILTSASLPTVLTL